MELIQFAYFSAIGSKVETSKENDDKDTSEDRAEKYEQKVRTSTNNPMFMKNKQNKLQLSNSNINSTLKTNNGIIKENIHLQNITKT